MAHDERRPGASLFDGTRQEEWIAISGLCGIDCCGLRSRSIVKGGGSFPGFQISSRTLRSRVDYVQRVGPTA
jgi:hypothetical protein